MHLLITGAWNSAKEHIPELEAMGHSVVFLQQEKDELPCEASWVEGVIGNGLFLYHPIESFPNLRYIQLTSAGYDRVDMDYIAAHHIEIHNAKGVYSIPMAEYALWAVLEVYKGGRQFAENQKAHAWHKQRDLRELSGKSVSIIGCGDVGRECAKRFRAMGCKVYGLNRTVRQREEYDRIYPLSEIDAVIPDADILILTMALTEETRHIMNASRFSFLKPTAVFVNIARGALADTDGLYRWLKEHPAASAVLDVFEEEPLPEKHPLWGLQNAILTPHNSFVGDRNNLRISKVVLEPLKDT